MPISRLAKPEDLSRACGFLLNTASLDVCGADQSIPWHGDAKLFRHGCDAFNGRALLTKMKWLTTGRRVSYD